MRKKKHLAERLEKARRYLITAENDILDVREAVADKKYIDFSAVFGNDNPVVMEIGCGRGGFITQVAKNHPEINFVAVELIANVIVLACEKAAELKLDNLRFMNTGAEYLPRYVSDGSISTVFLNFSPPYPQKTHENRRLTNAVFLQNYKKMLVSDGIIYQKTDDKEFFDYSAEKFKECGYEVTDFSVGGVNPFSGFLTEYEKKFLSQNLPIYSLSARKK